jgi:hypothetical protein
MCLASTIPPEGRTLVLDLIASNRWAQVGVAYSVGFWAVLMWVFMDARKQGKTHAFLYALGIALVFPVGIFLHRGNRDWD